MMMEVERRTSIFRLDEWLGVLLADGRVVEPVRYGNVVGIQVAAIVVLLRHTARCVDGREVMAEWLCDG